MVEFISSWAEQIIVSLIIVIVFELIIPEGKNKKYIKLVMGIFILYSIISPITGNKLKNIDIESIVEESNIATTSTNNVSYSVVDSNIEKLYEKNLKENIQDTLNKNGYTADNIVLKINYEEGDNYGEVENIQVDISKGVTKNDNNIKIEEVNVSDSKETKSNISNDEAENIKKILSETYGTKMENIIIGG